MIPLWRQHTQIETLELVHAAIIYYFIKFPLHTVYWTIRTLLLDDWGSQSSQSYNLTLKSGLEYLETALVEQHIELQQQEQKLLHHARMCDWCWIPLSFDPNAQFLVQDVRSCHGGNNTACVIQIECESCSACSSTMLELLLLEQRCSMTWLTSC